jgi:hypothetical protein
MKLQKQGMHSRHFNHGLHRSTAVDASAEPLQFMQLMYSVHEPTMQLVVADQ